MEFSLDLSKSMSKRSPIGSLTNLDDKGPASIDRNMSKRSPGGSLNSLEKPSKRFIFNTPQAKRKPESLNSLVNTEDSTRSKVALSLPYLDVKRKPKSKLLYLENMTNI